MGGKLVVCNSCRYPYRSSVRNLSDSDFNRGVQSSVCPIISVVSVSAEGGSQRYVERSCLTDDRIVHVMMRV